MKIIGWSLITVAVCLLTLSLYDCAQRVNTRVTLTFPLATGTNELRATLPVGRYAMVIASKVDERVLGVIPPQRSYASEVIVRVNTSRGVLLEKTNMHYATFTLGKSDPLDVVFDIQIHGRPKDERVFLHVGRGF